MQTRVSSAYPDIPLCVSVLGSLQLLRMCYPAIMDTAYPQHRNAATGTRSGTGGRMPAEHTLRSPFLQPALDAASQLHFHRVGRDEFDEIRMTPTLRRSDYYTVPSMDELGRLSPTELRRVRDFRVGRVGFGEVHWLGETDVSGICPGFPLTHSLLLKTQRERNALE